MNIDSAFNAFGKNVNNESLPMAMDISVEKTAYTPLLSFSDTRSDNSVMFAKNTEGYSKIVKYLEKRNNK